MGVDKASLPHSPDQTLLQWQCERLSKAGFDVVAGLADRRDGFQGPLAGIEAALLSEPVKTDWLVMPVDMPNLRAQTLAQLAEYGQRHEQAVYLRHYPLPMYLPKQTDLAQTLAAYLDDAQSSNSIRGFLACLNAHSLALPESPNEMINMNTPSEWQVYLQQKDST